MNNKKQIIGYSLLIALSIAFILCCLFLPLAYIKLCNFDSGDVLVEQNFSLIEFTKLAGLGAIEEFIWGATGPAWLTVGAIYFNVLTIIGCVLVLVLSIIGLILACRIKSFSFKNSVVYKIAGFVGAFAVITAIFQIVGFIVLTSLANNLMVFKPLLGCFVNAIIGLAILILSFFVKDKEGLLPKNKIRDAICFGLTALVSIALGVILIKCSQFSADPPFGIIEPEYSTIFGVNQVANYFMGSTYADYPMGICFYFMVLVIICLAFLAIYSIIGVILSLSGKSTNWLSVRVKRWGIATICIFSILFMLIICILMILGGKFMWIIPQEGIIASCLSVWAYVEFVLPFAILILTSFIGVYKKDTVENTNNKTSNPQQIDAGEAIVENNTELTASNN